MRAYIISDSNNKLSEQGVKNCFKSLWDNDSEIIIEPFQQTSPDTLVNHLEDFPELKWNYPVYNETRVDEETGVTLRGYKTNDINKVFACTISHARLWKICVERSEEIMILEHDAIFTRKFEPFEWKGGVLGLNDPRGATHSSMLFHSIVSNNEGVQNTPWVKPAFDIPQGLAGNSAYIIKPYFAEKLLNKLKQKGGWPNDALMCKQFFPNELKVIYPYYTKLQPMQSTTTL